MKTDDLIRALSADVGAKSPSIEVAATFALAGGIAVTASIFFAAIGFRPDLAQVLESVRFLYKFLVVLSITVPAVALCVRLARPDADIGAWGLGLALTPALLVLGVAAELLSTPPMLWGARLVGTNMPFCLTIIPMLSVGTLAGLFLALRHGAPTRPRLAGGFAGLAAGAVAALFYASNCTDDSPLFVATWYTIAIGSIALAGSLLGPKLLKW